MKKKYKINKSKLLKTEWTWDYQKWEHGERIQGVEIKGRKLLWWTESYPGYTGGLSCTQNIEDFLVNGPKISGVPEKIIKEMKETIEKAIV